MAKMHSSEAFYALDDPLLPGESFLVLCIPLEADSLPSELACVDHP